MFVMYVDESGDPGPHVNAGSGNSRHFILSGLVVPMVCWNDTLDRFKDFRRDIRKRFGLPMREELHASELIRINRIDAYRAIKKHDRIRILTDFVTQLPTICNDSKLINICLDKAAIAGTATCKEIAWNRLIQRYHTYMTKCGAKDPHGIIVADGMEDVEVRGLLRKMRVFNYVPSRFGQSRSIPTRTIIEDIIARDSKHSYFVQAVDAVAHVLYRQEYPKGSLKKYQVDRLFGLLDPLLLKQAAAVDPQGIVRK